MDYRRFRRYVLFSLQAICEYIRGLDFTMRDTHLLKENRGLHGYSKTNEKHIKEIWGNLKEIENSDFLDIGCGKGVVLREASKAGFKSVTGIDIDANLIRIAKKNFSKLHMKNIECINIDALEFDYSKYNVFYFFNPFCEPFFESVIDKIVNTRAQNPSRKGYIIYHNPVFADVLKKRGMDVSCTLYDEMKDYKTYIYELK